MTSAEELIFAKSEETRKKMLRRRKRIERERARPNLKFTEKDLEHYARYEERARRWYFEHPLQYVKHPCCY